MERNTLEELKAHLIATNEEFRRLAEALGVEEKVGRS